MPHGAIWEVIVSLGLQATITGVIAFFLLDLRFNDAFAVAMIGLAGYIVTRWIEKFLAGRFVNKLKITRPTYQGGGGRNWHSGQHDLTV